MIIEMNNGTDFVVYEQRFGGNTVEIVDIAANSGHRKGTGRRLINALVDHLKDEQPYNLYALCRRSNADAQAFYKAMGFEQLALLSNFYIDKDKEDPKVITREDAVVVGRVVGCE